MVTRAVAAVGLFAQQLAPAAAAPASNTVPEPLVAAASSLAGDVTGSALAVIMAMAMIAVLINVVALCTSCLGRKKCNPGDTDGPPPGEIVAFESGAADQRVSAGPSVRPATCSHAVCRHGADNPKRSKRQIEL